ncbi:divalent-cation tolerance protein CutA [Nitrospina sp. 32_T5]|uniref:divalent-cation tolerance protein CutA n=1 Tax=unclassified Nitrospina TaxID=2638683 RepID=UPI003F95F135
MDEHVVVYVTAGSEDEAEKLANGLVTEKLAFCVNVIPSIKSYYYWDGKMNVDPEVLMIIKTRRDRFDDLEKWVCANHSYDVPEVIALPIVKGLKPYLQGIDDWVPKK